MKISNSFRITLIILIAISMISGLISYIALKPREVKVLTNLDFATQNTPNLKKYPDHKLANEGEDSVNGYKNGNLPFDVNEGDTIHINIGKFDQNTNVHFYLDGIKKELTSNNNGYIVMNYVLPKATPGIHELELTGGTNGGVMYGKVIRLNYPGNPQPAQTYGFYVCCFTPPSTDYDYYTASFQLENQNYEKYIDEDGGVYFQIFVASPSGKLTLNIKHSDLNETITKVITIDPLDKSLI